MNHLEERVRRALHAEFSGIETEQVLADVHRGADRRRNRRAAAVAAASVAAIVGLAGVAALLHGDEGARPEPLSSPRTATTAPAEPGLPPGATHGVIDVSVAAPDAVFRLTTNVGCVACSTIWRQDPSVEGGWQRLHDFEGKTAYGGEVDPSFGPVEYFAMSANGRDGWAWGQRLHSTHDGGRTWTQIDFGPGGLTDQGHGVQLSTNYAWSLFRSAESGTQLFRTPIGADDWATVRTPGLSGVSGIVTVGDRVVLEASGEGLTRPRLLVSETGATWSELDLPCGGENEVLPAESVAFVLCADGTGATVYRSVDLTDWEVFGESTGVVSAVHPLSDERLLIVGDAATARLMTPSGTTPVDLGLRPGEETYRSSSSGELSYVTTFDSRLLGSTDGGHSWHEVD
jgi:hypothetical protein